MKAIVPDGKSGVFLADVPMPDLFADAVLCRMTHSLISCGTERKIIRECSGKTPEALIAGGSRLGYCGAGVVEQAQGEGVAFEKGQRVGFYGAPWVSHSESVVVPKHLILPLPDQVSSEQGPFLGMGAIALHGFRQASPGLGESCYVAGAGVIGNLCAQFALLSGCRVTLSDYDASRLEVFRRCVRSEKDLSCVTPDEAEASVLEQSEGRGADAVFLCMATESSGPMEQAVELVRPGGRIVILGVLDIQVPRDAFFLKEAQLTISRAAGPGRYEQDYEKKGIDYPPQYVRWTEGRNLAEALRQMAMNRLQVEPLICRTVSIDEISDVYTEIVQGKPELGYVIKWD